jgi:chorismate dehydratase
MGQAPIQIGWIPYWNLLPLQHELQRLSGGNVKLVTGHPTTVNRWLSDGTVHLAPASSITLLKTKNLELALPLGIASDGPVQSVYLGLHRHHEEFLGMINRRQRVLSARFAEAMSFCAGDQRQMARRIWSASRVERPDGPLPRLHLSSASAASAALTRLLVNLWLGESQAAHLMAQATTVKQEVSELGVDDLPVELVIGDEALQRRHEFWRVLDLGQVWQELTAMPFVFGLWQTSSKILPPSLRHMIAEAGSIAQARMRVEPQAFFPENPVYGGDGNLVDLASYWRVIQYRLGERHMRSLLLYFSLYLEICGRPDQDMTTERYVRWNQLWNQPGGLGVC